MSSSQRVLEHPVSRINKDARSLMGAAGILDVSRDHETPGVSLEVALIVRAGGRLEICPTARLVKGPNDQ